MDGVLICEPVYVNWLETCVFACSFFFLPVNIFRFDGSSLVACPTVLRDVPEHYYMFNIRERRGTERERQLTTI